MKQRNNRREFIKKVSLTGLGLGLVNSFPMAYAEFPEKTLIHPGRMNINSSSDPTLTFIPHRTAQLVGYYSRSSMVTKKYYR